MLAWRMLWRNWRSGELKLLSVALLLAVAVVSSIAIFTDRLQSTLVQESNTLLGADRIVRSSRPFDETWFAQAEQLGVDQSQVVTFSTMVFAEDEMHLASVKAVGEGYPLRGQVETAERPFETRPDRTRVETGIPAPGEAWVDSRLLPLLGIELGDSLSVGEYSLTATRVLVAEPDGGSPFSFFGVRLMMNLDDLPRTEVVQPGSRVTYQWLLAADREASLQQMLAWLEPRLSLHERLVDIQEAQQGLANALYTGERFLLLAAVIGVLLAGVAIALAARHFAERHVDQVALMKSLGASALRVRLLYLGQLLLLGVTASLLGLLAGELIQRLVASSLASLYGVTLGAAGFSPYALSFLAGLLCLACFALPSLWFLPGIPPLRILRRELPVSGPRAAVQIGLALFAIAALVWLFSQQVALALSVVLALLVVLLVSVVLALLLLHLSRRISAGAGSYWRLAVAGLQRRKVHSVTQIVVFATAIMLLLTLTIVRTSLIDDWRMQLPENAPNHFLVNIAPHEVEPVQQLLDERGVAREPLYPMVRGRLTHINDAEPSEELRRGHNVFQREVNLTWTDTLAEDNRVVAGQWWDRWQPGDLPGVSIEDEMAEEMGLALGDVLRFSIGGLILEARVASMRSLDWRSMRPNFYFIFEPGTLDDFAPTYITSAYLPVDEKPVINELLRRHPTVSVMELDRIIAQIQTIIQQVSNGVLLVLWLTLLGGCLVLLAAVTSSMESRRQEAGLLRALGSGRRLIVGSVWSEFSVLGLVAGIIAVLGSELLLLSLQRFVFDTPIQPHYLFWFLGPALGALLVGGLGALSCRSVVRTPPAVVLRQA